MFNENFQEIRWLGYGTDIEKFEGGRKYDLKGVGSRFGRDFYDMLRYLDFILKVVVFLGF